MTSLKDLRSQIFSRESDILHVGCRMLTCVLQIGKGLVCLPDNIGFAIDIEHRLLAHVVPYNLSLPCNESHLILNLHLGSM